MEALARFRLSPRRCRRYHTALLIDGLASELAILPIVGVGRLDPGPQDACSTAVLSSIMVPGNGENLVYKGILYPEDSIWSLFFLLSSFPPDFCVHNDGFAGFIQYFADLYTEQH